MKKIAVVAALGVIFAGTAWAQANKRPASDWCKNTLTSELKNFEGFHDAVIKNKRLLPFQQDEVKKSALYANEIKTGFAKTGLTDADCDGLRSSLHSQRFKIEQKVSQFEQASACVDSARGLANNVVSQADFAVGLKAMSVAERDEAKKRIADIRSGIDASIADGKITGDSCIALSGQISGELGRVMGLTRPRIDCNNNFKRYFSTNKSSLDDALNGKLISESERESRKKAEADWQKRYDEAFKDELITTAECTPLLNEVKTESDSITKLLKERRKVKACVDNVDSVMANAGSTLAKGVADKKISADEQAKIKTSHETQKTKLAEIKKDNIVTLGECTQLLSSVQQHLDLVKQAAAN